jgi:hypothetical protein
VTNQDPVQRIVGHSWPGEGYGGIIKVYNASDPLAGPIATYDTGDLIYSANDQAMWIDALSIPGIDRIFYTNFGGGCPTEGYQFRSIDWDGTSLVNSQTLPKPDGYGIWSLCFTPEGDIIWHNSLSISPMFYRANKSTGYLHELIFTLPQSVCPYGAAGDIRAMVYDPLLDAVILLCHNDAVSNGGQLFALDLTGQLLFQDLDVFGTSTLVSTYMGLNIDLDDPGCRIVAYVGPDDGTARFARYSADLEEKKVTQDTSGYYFYGTCRGGLQTDGTLWASSSSGSARFYKFAAPPDW